MTTSDIRKNLEDWIENYFPEECTDVSSLESLITDEVQVVLESGEWDTAHRFYSDGEWLWSGRKKVQKWRPKI